MSYQLSRVRLTNIGDRAARFSDTPIDLAAPAAAGGDPLDSILWLRNGGGKSSLLSLFFALVLPRRDDFLGVSVKRYIEDYIAAGDTSHMAAEWVDVRADALFAGGGRQLVIGAVYEWDERRKPVDTQRNRDKLKINYYAFTATPGLLTLDTLPLADDAGRPIDRASFIRRLREVAAEHPDRLQLTVTDAPMEWMKELTARHLDPALFRYQKRMNHSEGGVAELFNFDTSDKFINLLIDLTVDSAQPERVAGNLRNVADILAAKPQRELEARFCETLAGKLDVLDAEHAAASAAVAAAAGTAAAASALAGALDGAATAHAARQERLLASLGELETQQADAERDRLRTRATANELVLRAERFRAATAVADVGDRTSEQDAARAIVAAWEAVEPLAVHADAQEQIGRIRVQQAAEEKQNAPLRQQHDTAALALRLRYGTLETAERDRAARAADTATEADKNAKALRDQQRTADSQRATARAERDTVTRQLDALARDLAAAVDAGDLPDADTDPAAHADHVEALRGAAVEQLQAVREARRARVGEREQLAARRSDTAVARRAREGERAALADEHRKLAARAAAMAGHDRLHELLQLDDDTPVDLWADTAGLRAALIRAAADADTAVVAARVDAAEDVRALDALTGTGFLPTTRDAQRVADALTAAGVVARPGWELLRDVVDTPARAAALQSPTLAALASGVVVADPDLDAARRVLQTGALTAVAHVPVATAADLEAAVHADPTAWAVTAPTPGLFDQAAADADRTDRERHRATRDREIAGWSAQARADRQLLTALDALVADCPAGHLDALARDVADADADVADLDKELQALTERAGRLATDEQADAGTETRLSGQLSEQAGQLARLRVLAAKVAERPALTAALEEYTARIDELDLILAGLGEDAAEQEALRDTAAGEAVERRVTAGRYATDAAGIQLLGDTDAARGAGAAVDDDPAPLSTLLSRYDGAAREWTAVAAQSVLAERLRTQNERAAAAGRALADVDPDVLATARQLLGTADGQDERSRKAALDRARAELEGARDAVVRAGEELKAAEEAVRNAVRVRERDRRGADLEREPVDQADARAQAERYAAASTAASEQATALGRELDEAKTQATDAKLAAGLFGQQVSRLRDAVRQAAPTTAANASTADVPAAPAEVFGGTVEDAEPQVTAVVSALTEAAAAAGGAAKRVDRAVTDVRKAATEFAGIEDPIKERLTGDDPAYLASLAGARAGELRARRQQIVGMLADIHRDQDLVVTQVAALVNDVLTTMNAAQRHSKLPGSLGEWSDQQFLTIRFTKPASEEDLRVRIAAVLDAVVGEGSKPEGLALLKRCVHAAVAPRGFKVTVLKPNSDLAVEPLDITLLGKYSGGEKLTVCVALYCTLARLRAVNRGLGHVGGTLVLDNPLGTASHVQLLRLQRAVAAAHGVQLVYTTGVEDLGAVGQFPNVVRLRNSPGTLRHRRYVTVESRTGSAFDDEEGITGVRVARVDGAAS